MPLTAPTAAPVSKHRQDHEWRGVGDAEDKAADDRREREVGANREVDAAGQDDELLADRDDGDHGRLGEDVANVAGLQKIRRQQADRPGEHDEDEKRTDAQ